MSVSTRIVSLLGTGTAAGARVFRSQVTTSPARPYIIFQTISSAPINSHAENAGLYEHLVQVSCYADNPDAAEALRAQAIALLEGEHAAGPILVDSLREGPEESVTPALHRADADFTVWDAS